MEPIVEGIAKNLLSPDNIGGTVTAWLVIGITAAAIGSAAGLSE